MNEPVGPAPPLTVMTVNTHKGFTTFNRRFILPELRDAVRKVGADIVFLQEVLGTHEEHGVKLNGAPHYEFMADSIWPEFAYGRNVVYPKGHHGNAVMSKFPIVRHQNHDVSIAGPEKRGMLHCVLRIPGPAKTFPARFPLLALDRIYVRNASVHLPVVLPRRPWSHLSDHAPLVAEIHL